MIIIEILSYTIDHKNYLCITLDMSNSYTLLNTRLLSCRFSTPTSCGIIEKIIMKM